MSERGAKKHPLTDYNQVFWLNLSVGGRYFSQSVGGLSSWWEVITPSVNLLSALLMLWSALRLLKLLGTLLTLFNMRY